jgi:hypothetical protein
MGAFGIGVLVGTVWHLIRWDSSHAELMGVIGMTALSPTVASP